MMTTKSSQTKIDLKSILLALFFVFLVLGYAISMGIELYCQNSLWAFIYLFLNTIVLTLILSHRIFIKKQLNREHLDFAGRWLLFQLLFPLLPIIFSLLLSFYKHNLSNHESLLELVGGVEAYLYLTYLAIASASLYFESKATTEGTLFVFILFLALLMALISGFLIGEAENIKVISVFARIKIIVFLLAVFIPLTTYAKLVRVN